MNHRRAAVAVLFLLSVAASACHNPSPAPQWLRCEATDLTGWTRGDDGKLRCAVGKVQLQVDCAARDTRMEVLADNHDGRDIVLRLGAHSASSSGAMGEVWRRPLHTSAGEDVPEALPYLARQPVELRQGWRATFFVQDPLGREPSLGQYFVLVFEIESKTGERLGRAELPMVTTNRRPDRR